MTDVWDAAPGPRRGRRRILVIGVALIAGIALVALVASLTPAPSPSPMPRDTVMRSPMPSAWPTPTPHYAAVFEGDATGTTDVTAALRTFLRSHDGEHVALAPDALYRVSSVRFTAHDLTVDFRGARLDGTVAGDPVLVIVASTDVVLNDPATSGTGYEWAFNTQWEHGISIDGGSGITLNRPVTRDTRGDGIYIGYSNGYTLPAERVLIVDPDIERAARNGISPVAGQVSILGGRIAHTGLMGVDFEPNDATGAGSIQGVVDGVDIRSHGDLPAADPWCTCWAVAGEGATTATKPSITVKNLTGDELSMTMRDTAIVVVQDNVSDVDAVARFLDAGSVTFTGNVRISQQ